MQEIEGTHMLFITAGMGGGTGTGGAPVIAKAAREKGILTVGIITKPFQFEGPHRAKSAEKGMETMKECVDTLLVIPNQNLFRLANDSTTFTQAFSMADDVLYSAVRTFTDLMIKPGLVNLDFADICAVMKDMMGKAMMGTGEASGDGRAIEAAEKAISCPLIEDVAVKGAKAILINITGGLDLTLYEVDESAGRIKQEVDPDANIIFGATFDEKLQGTLRVSVVATGIDNEKKAPQKSEIKIQSKLYKDRNAPLSEEGLAANTDFNGIGSRHENFSFDKPHFSSFSLREEEETFGDSENELSENISSSEDQEFDKIPEKEATRKLSIFERLTGRSRRPLHKASAIDKKSEASREKDGNLFSFSKKKLSPQENSTDFSETEDLSTEELEVPAFLRQKKKKTKYF